MDSFDVASLTALTKEMINASGIKMGNAMPIIRAALTGKTHGPDVHAIAVILGKEKAVEGLYKLTTRKE